MSVWGGLTKGEKVKRKKKGGPNACECDQCEGYATYLACYLCDLPPRVFQLKCLPSHVSISAAWMLQHSVRNLWLCIFL